jgi:Sec-independent protein translocase protein TatA
MVFPLAFLEGLNTGTLLMLGIVALLLFGERLPEVARTWGRKLRKFI